MSADINLDDPALTKREALRVAYDRLGSVVWFSLDQDREPDAMDKESLRLALKMVALVLDGPNPNATRPKL